MENPAQIRRLAWPAKAASLEEAQAGLEKAGLIVGELLAEVEQARRETRENPNEPTGGARYGKLRREWARARAIERVYYWQVEEFLRPRWWHVRGQGKITQLRRRALGLDEAAELQEAWELAVEGTDYLREWAERRRADGEGSEIAAHFLCDQHDRAVKIERALYRQSQRLLRRRELWARVRGVGRAGWKVLEAGGKVRRVLRGAGG